MIYSTYIVPSVPIVRSVMVLIGVPKETPSRPSYAFPADLNQLPSLDLPGVGPNNGLTPQALPPGASYMKLPRGIDDSPLFGRMPVVRSVLISVVPFHPLEVGTMSWVTCHALR